VRNCLNGPEPTVQVAIYHCQQAAEKLVKAALVADAINPPRGHDIGALVDRLRPDHPLHGVLSELEELTVYAIAYRYPSGDILSVPPEPLVEEVAGWVARIIAARDKLRGLLAGA